MVILYAPVYLVKGETHNLSPLEAQATIKCRWMLCGEWFSSLNDLANHVSHTHAVAACQGLFYCGWEGCSRPHKGFNARYKMLVHVRTHTNEKPHQCPECNKSFSRAENLKIHARSHTGEKPYTCPVPGCHKAYSNSSDRFKHTRTHSIEKPYICKVPGCNKRYTDPSSLRKHAKTYSHFVTTQQTSIDMKKKTEPNYNSDASLDSNILRNPQTNCEMIELLNPVIEFKSDVNYKNKFNYSKEIQNEAKNQMITDEVEERELQLECVTTHLSTSWLQSLYPNSVLSWSKLEEQDTPLDLTVHPSSYH